MTATDVGTLAIPGVVLDRRTQDELQPPCDAGRTPCWCALCRGRVTDRHACKRPALWVLSRWGCACLNASVICCTQHADEALDHEPTCLGCGASISTSREPLR